MRTPAERDFCFQKAFGKDINVGIISVRNPDYDPKHWWRYSEGVREITSEINRLRLRKIHFSSNRIRTERTGCHTNESSVTAAIARRARIPLGSMGMAKRQSFGLIL